MKHQSRPMQRGVSLIEVLVALFVLAFACSALPACRPWR